MEEVMSFVFSIWYFVMLFLVAGIVASLFIFFKMDRKYKELINKFIEDSQAKAEPQQEVAAETKAE